MQIVPLDDKHDRSGFDCGNAALNSFLKTMARQASSKDLSRTFVLIDEKEPATILGFFSLASCQVDILDVPMGKQKKYPPQHGLPAVRLARLAISVKVQGSGLGAALLAEVVHRTALVAESVGIIGLFVDAKDNTARRFYEKFGFVVTNHSKPLQLFLPTASLPKE